MKESVGYEYWVKLHNLQEQSKTLNYLTKNGLLDGEKLNQDLTKLTTVYQQCKSELKATEAELKAVNRKLRLLGQYYKTRPVYREYVKGRKQKEFFSAHQSDLELYEAAAKELREVFGDIKLPGVQSLKGEKEQLMARKKEQYKIFKVLRTQWVELSKLAKNRDSMIVPDKQTARDNKKDI